MAVFGMGDLHLPLSVSKPMDVFGSGWENYVDRIKVNWDQTVGDNDIVMLCGDISWATYLEDAYQDFLFIHERKGIKLISKGNHDYWWSTMSKMNQALQNWGFDSIRFLHNSAYLYENTAICATRGYALDDKSTEHDRKIYEREKIRMRLSVEEGKKFNPKQLILALHYPPDEEYRRFITDELDVDICLFGHLHGEAAKQYQAASGFHLVSSDFLEFRPKKIEF